MKPEELGDLGLLIDTIMTVEDPDIANTFSQLLMRAKLMGPTPRQQEVTYFGFEQLAHRFLDAVNHIKEMNNVHSIDIEDRDKTVRFLQDEISHLRTQNTK